MQYCCTNIHFHCLSTGDVDFRPSARDKSSSRSLHYYVFFAPWQHSIRISWSYGFGYSMALLLAAGDVPQERSRSSYSILDCIRRSCGTSPLSCGGSFMLLGCHLAPGKFFDDNSAGIIPLSCDKESGEQVNTVVLLLLLSTLQEYT